jgi:uncharacterized protein (TIGR03089 family)
VAVDPPAPELTCAPATVPDALASAVTGGDSARPLLTWYDDASGDRAELSGVTLANWVAKTANLLVDGCGLGPGEVAWVDAPPHWQTAAVLLGCWCAGLRTGPTGAGSDVVFAAADRVAGYASGGTDVFGLALAPMAAPMRDVPPGVLDFVTEVRGHGDEFHPAAPVTPDQPATTLTHGALCAAAVRRADALGVGAGSRVLIDVTVHPDPLDWLLAPLVVGASVVLCGHLDRSVLPRRLGSEQVTVELTTAPTTHLQ